ncbi:MFS transporter [Candidatus Palibaumannia cicadellinicola]|uniref:Sialic acid transporter (Permease) NanT n=1 Tax=Candidatus Palibaumannia cicadellinicola TaxID=186490 RepID=A0A088MXK2_9GAMM|nr:MFS transporter [Candidatus Baumannia cicadellinicola]AIN46919.1 Sialic acid transporter (permease) NanT [Candidatus Baumannia cicadellinicola]
MQPIKLNLLLTEQISSISLTKYHKYLICIFIIGNILVYFDFFLFNFIIILLMKDPTWSLSTTQCGFIFSSAGVGIIIGAIVLGWFADKHGSKNSFILCLMMLVTCTGFSALTPVNNWIYLSFLRICVGIAVGGFNVIAIPYIQEFLPDKKRGLFTGICLAFVPLGLFGGALTTRYLADILSWREMFSISYLPVLLLAWIKFIPESPRYLVCKGRFQDARKAYAWVMNIPECNVINLPEYEYIHKLSYKNIIKSYPREIIIVAVGSFCFILGCFVIQSWGQILLNQCFNFSINMVNTLFMILSFGSIVGRLISSWISDYIGRRWTLFACGFIGAMGCIIAALYQHITTIMHIWDINIISPDWIFFIGIFIVMMFGDGAFSILNVFGGELFPHQIRSTCLGLGYGVGATAKIIGPILLSTLIGRSSEDIVLLPFLIFAFIFMLGSIVYLFARETSNQCN